MTEESGWTTSYCLYEEGFPQILWETLMRFGYTQRPEYQSKEYEEFETKRCDVYVRVFQTPEYPEWPPWGVMATGFRWEDAYQKAARKAIMQFCQDHESEVGHSAVKYYPVTDPDQPTWRRRIRRLQGPRQIENDPTLVAIVKYLHTLDSFLETKLWELVDCIARAEEAEAKNRVLEEKLEEARAATIEAEQHTYQAAQALRETKEKHISEVNKIYQACHQAHGGPRRRRTARKSTFALPWNPRDRTEDLPGLPVLPLKVRYAIEHRRFKHGQSSTQPTGEQDGTPNASEDPMEQEPTPGDQEERMDTEEEDPSERERASDDWEDKEVIREGPKLEDDAGASQQAGEWLEVSD